MPPAQGTPTRKQALAGASSNQQVTPLHSGLPPDTSQLSDDQFMQWGMSSTPFNDTFGSMSNQYLQPSNQLIRRNTNQQVATSNQGFNMDSRDGQLVPSDGQTTESYEELERRAAIAKKDAQSKSPPKNIPPFIQKLSKFLDESNADEATRELIRWSDDGHSFIVLDEDRFAQNLVPELFKHSNYASFVRQLNMYGFHKKVGLSDNSMRASEKKSKSPSEYENPYFKRGRPELLWLIQKPKSEAVHKKRKKGNNGDQDSGDEFPRLSNDVPVNGQAAANPNTDVVSKLHYVSLQREVQGLQNSQRQITQMLTRLRDENNQYIRQASTLVAQHERHENSINAILTFLATFYNRNMEGGNMAGMFPGAMPNNQPQGNVVDVGDGDYDESFQNHLQRPQRRPLALLPAPSPASGISSQQATPNPASANSPQSPQLRSRPERRTSPRGNTPRPIPLQARVSSYQSSPRASPTPPIKDSPKTPDLFNQYLQDNDSPSQVQNHDDMMNMIHSVNEAQANGNENSSHLNFNDALQHMHSNGNRALTPQQRENVLHLMNSQSGATTPLPTTSKPIDNASQHTNQSKQVQLNSYLNRFTDNRDHLDMLQRLQEQQDSKVQDLADRLQPLSPSGSIPGLALSPTNSNVQLAQPPGLYNNPSFGNSGDFDINAFLNSDYYTNPNQPFDPNTMPDFTNGDFDFGDIDTNGVNGDVNTDTNANAPATHDPLFGSDPDENEDEEEAASPQTYADYGNAAGGAATAARRAGSIAGGGEILGSVGSSSGAPSPMVEEVEDEEEGSARKKRKTGGRA